MAEIESHVLNGQCLNRRIPVKEQVEEEIKAWQNARKNKKSKINWRRKTKDVRTNLSDFLCVKAPAPLLAIDCAKYPLKLKLLLGHSTITTSQKFVIV